MIKISVDEGAAFDILSILEVKAMRGGDTTREISRLVSEIASETGNDTYCAIATSEEYTSLRQTNAALFDLIDALKERGERVGDAIKVDDLNYARYLAKKALQTRFFPSNPMTEVKLGYTK